MMKCNLNLQDIKDVMRIGKNKEVVISVDKSIEILSMLPMIKDRVLYVKKTIESDEQYSPEKKLIRAEHINLLNNKEVKINGNIIISGERYIEINDEEDRGIDEINCFGEFKINAIVPFEEFKIATEIINHADETDARPVLNTICLDEDNLIALDGYRLGIRKLSSSTDEQLLIPLYAINALRKIKDKKSDLYIESNKEYIRFRLNNTGYEIVCDRREGKYIDYKGLIPQGDFKTEMKVKSETLRKISAEYKKTRVYHMVCNFNDEISTSTAKLLGFTISDKFESELKGENLEIGIKPEYVYDALKHYKGEVTIQMNGAIAPILISQGNKTNLILPVRLVK